MTTLLNLGGVMTLIGLGMLIVGVVPAIRRSQRRYYRNAFLMTVIGFVLVGVAAETSPEDVAVAAATPSAAAPSASQGASIASVETPAAPQPLAVAEPTSPLAGTPQQVDRWVLQAGSSDRTIVFRRSLGDEWLGTTADAGYTYALVPVFIKNNTNRTESMGFATWVLLDDRGYEYTTESLGDMYLSERERLDSGQIPPGATRFGYLVFQVERGATGLTLEFGMGRNKRTWYFAGL